MNADEFRELLLEERARVVAALHHLQGDPASTDAKTVEETYDNHLADAATATLDRGIDSTLEENSVHVLAAIDQALRRIDEGSFGTCERCGKPIAEARLEAMPYATKCIDCKRLEERG